MFHARKVPIRLIVLLLGVALGVTAAAKPDPQLRVPPGFAIEVWAADLPDARTLALGTRGTVFVGSRKAGAIYALTDRNGDGRPDETRVLASGLQLPTGLAFHDGDLYVAEVDRLWKWPAIESRLDHPPERVMVRSDLPDKTHHGWRFIDFGPDGRLYLAIGAPCNVCAIDRFGPKNELEYASITRMNADGSDWQVVARGVRNSVGFTWHPQSKRLWLTDNGRDWLGDDSPSCELNQLTRVGEDFGFPYCHAGSIKDPDFGDLGRCEQATPPAARLGPHVAPLGLEFYSGAQFPGEYRGDLFVALHGSWNRSRKSGYRVDRVRLEGDRVVAVEPFVEGWLHNEAVSGRPADVMQMPDGSLLISDDLGGRIYRVHYVGES